jgi:dsDNA-specific endonuclease/ATPase MutS2
LQNKDLIVQLIPKDKVKIIDENLTGEVVKVEGEYITVDCEDGFEYQYKVTELIKMGIDGNSEHTTNSYSEKFKIKEVKQSPNSNFFLNGSKPIIDLHIEELAPDIRFSSNHEAFLFQINAVKQFIEIAINQRKRNIVFVHGVGNGKLRTRLRQLLTESYPNIEYLDGSYDQYGIGATEIIIHGLSKSINSNFEK